MPGPLPKHDERRQRRNKKGAGVQLKPALTLAQAPPAPKGLLVETAQQWRAYWTSEIARLVEAETDTPALRRLFSLYDERERAYRAYRRQRLVRGSQGQPVVNPVWKHVPVMDSEIRALEDRFGITPQSRLKLGITLGDAARSLEDLNHQLNEDDGPDEAGAPALDPRLRISR